MLRLGAAVPEAARAVGAPHVVYSAGCGAERECVVGAVDEKAHVAVAVMSSGQRFAIRRPSLFLGDLLGASLRSSHG